MKFAGLLLLALLLTACAPPLIVTPDFATLTPSPPASEPTATPCPVCDDAEAEYYRGIFDLCGMLYQDAAKCLDLADKARGSGWYEQPSRGWVWPLSVTY